MFISPPAGIKLGEVSRCAAMCICTFCLSVCLSVCLSTHISQKPPVQISSNFLYMLPVIVVWSSSEGTAIGLRYVLPVFWLDVVFSHRPNGANWPELNTIDVYMFRPVRQVAAPRSKSAVSDCIFKIAPSLVTISPAGRSGWLVNLRNGLLGLKTVTHPDTNHAVETNALPLRHATTTRPIVRFKQRFQTAEVR